MIFIPIPIRIRPPAGAMEHGILRPMNMPVPNPAMVRADEMAAMRTVGIAMVSQLLPIGIKAMETPTAMASMLVATASVRMTL